jgi:hypothetical protein
VITRVACRNGGPVVGFRGGAPGLELIRAAAGWMFCGILGRHGCGAA